MDVVNAEQARIAEEAGACAVMALERVPADIRAAGGVARMVSGLPLSVITAILVGYYIANPAISCVVPRPRLGGARFRRPDGMKPCEHTKRDRSFTWPCGRDGPTRRQEILCVAAERHEPVAENTSTE